MESFVCIPHYGCATTILNAPASVLFVVFLDMSLGHILYATGLP